MPPTVTDRSKAVVLMWSLLLVLVSKCRWCFTLCLFIILLVRFGLLRGHLLGNSCPLGWPFVLIVFCIFVIFTYFPFWFKERDLVFDCTSSSSLLFYYLIWHHQKKKRKCKQQKSWMAELNMSLSGRQIVQCKQDFIQRRVLALSNVESFYTNENLH